MNSVIQHPIPDDCVRTRSCLHMAAHCASASEGACHPTACHALECGAGVESGAEATTDVMQPASPHPHTAQRQAHQSAGSCKYTASLCCMNKGDAAGRLPQNTIQITKHKGHKGRPGTCVLCVWLLTERPPGECIFAEPAEDIHQ